MHTILICDDNGNSRELLSLSLKKEPQFQLVAQACDGKAALDLIERHRPDILILDIVLPEYDGVYIVRHVRNSMREYHPIIYILSGLGTDPLVRELNDLGVDFYSMKPVPMRVIIRNLNTLVKHCGNAETKIEGMGPELLADTIQHMLLRLGVMPHRVSSKCVEDALRLYTTNPEAFSMLTKVLYPRIAQKYGFQESSVEKNIRSVIAQIQRNKTELYNEIFSYSTKERITNGEFLSVMSAYISRAVRSGRAQMKNGYDTNSR